MYHVSLGLLQKKPFLHPHLLQLLLAVGLLRWTAPPEPWSPRYMSNDLSSFRGSLDALQLAPWETYAPRASLIHPKAIQQSDAYFDLETFCDYDRLARAASRGPLIAYLAEDGAPSRTPHASTGSTALEECQTESLSREDADLIEILWKQDVDLGIPLEDYRPCNAPTSQSLAAASPPPKSVEGSTVVPVDKLESKKDFEPSTNEPRVTSIDSETGEPIFEPVAGPSTIDSVLNSNSSADSFLDINALMGVVSEELFCADPEWAHMPGYSGASSPPFNGTDPFGGVLLQNVSMPSSLDASITAANMTMQQSSPAAISCFATTPAAAASTMGEAPGGVAGCSELTKPTVTDQHAIRDLFTYNTSTQGSWDSFELFYEDLTAIASNNSNANNNHSESNRVVPLGHPSVSQPTDRVNATPSNGASVSLKHTTIGDGGYAASDTGVSSMYSDEANEEWMESSSETSHDHDQEQLVSTDISYHSNSSSMSFGSSEGCAVPQKKYNFFGRKPYQQQGQTSSGTMELSEESHVVPQPIKIAHDPAMDGFLHNHSYGQEQLSSGYSVPQLPIGVKLEQLRPDPKKQRALSQADGYDSSDPSESGAGYIQVTSAKDERRARELKIPIPTEEIVTLSIDEFNERLARYELTEDQHVLIRDIRRRGKNKVAAQNCRKRKLDQISALQGEVENFQDTCRSLQNENNELTRREAFVQQRLSQLRDVIANAANSGAIPKHHGHHDRMANSE